MVKLWLRSHYQYETLTFSLLQTAKLLFYSAHKSPASTPTSLEVFNKGRREAKQWDLQRYVIYSNWRGCLSHLHLHMNGTLTEKVSRSAAMARSTGAPALISTASDLHFISPFICIELLLLYHHQLSLSLSHLSPSARQTPYQINIDGLCVSTSYKTFYKQEQLHPLVNGELL